MGRPLHHSTCRMRAETAFQEMDGFGVNMNSKCWKDGALAPVVDLLIDDLGARLFRVDVFGKSDWVDTSGAGGPGLITDGTLEASFSSPDARNGWGMIRHLNARGISPYLTASGDVPRWMRGPDGKTLVDLDSFSRLMASYLEWAVRREKLEISLFGCLNETDYGSPEGPSLDPKGYARALERLVRELDGRGLGGVKLVAPEQGRFNCDYIREILALPALAGRIGVFGLHVYSDPPPEAVREPVALMTNTAFAGIRAWMTEYGDLDQSGEREWFVAWVSTKRLFALLEAGFNGAMAWDAYDNVHDHDGSWTIYGLLRVGLRAFTPKKRYYAARQVYRWVKPGFRRVAVECAPADSVRMLGFTSPEGDDATLVGMNESARPVMLTVDPEGLPVGVRGRPLLYSRTTETEDCVRAATVRPTAGQWPYDSATIELPPECIFTLTTLEE